MNKLIRVNTADAASVAAYFEDSLEAIRQVIDEARLETNVDDGEIDRHAINRALDRVEQHHSNLQVIMDEAIAGMAAALENSARVEEDLHATLNELALAQESLDESYSIGFENGVEETESELRWEFSGELDAYEAQLKAMKAQVENVRAAVQLAQNGDPEAMQWLIDWVETTPNEPDFDLDIFDESEGDESDE